MDKILTRDYRDIELSDYICRVRKSERRMNYHFPDCIAPRPKGQIAIARDFGLVLNDYGNLILLGRDDGFHLIDSHGQRVSKVAATYTGHAVMTENGRIFISDKDQGLNRPYVIDPPYDVADIAASEGHVAVLFRDGSLTVVNESGGWECVPSHQLAVKDWHDIKQVAVGYYNIMGLTKDGRVLYHSEDSFTDRYFYDHIDNGVQIDCYSHYYGTPSSMVLRADGTVVSDTFKEAEAWRDIIQISVGADIAIGLRKDGRLEVQDDRGCRLKIKDWKDLVSVECKFFGVVGITRHGDILSLFI